MNKLDRNYIFIALLGAAFFLPFLGGVHLFDWDEINFAECAREMILTDDYLRPRINFEPFWEKPPLFIWLQTAAMQAFGVSEFSARLPNAVCGIATLLTIYHLGKKLYDKTFGWLWTLAYVGSILPHLYFKSGIIDPWFNFFIFLSLVFHIKNEEVASLKLQAEGNKPQAESDKRQTASGDKPSIFSFSITPYLLFAGLFSGFAILTKGPVGFLIVALTWLCKSLIYRELSLKKIVRFTAIASVAVATAAIWFGVEILKNGFWFVNEFIIYNIRLAKTEDAGHGGFIGYHFVVLFFGCFPSSVFALRSILRGYSFVGEKVDFTRWMRILFLVVLVLFSLVQSKIVHYSSMCYLPLTFLAAISMKSWLDEGVKIPRFYKITVVVVGILLGSIVAAVPFLGQNIGVLKPLFQHDLFALKNLDAFVHWSGGEAAAGFVLILTVFLFFFIEKKGEILRGLIFLFFGTAIFLQLVMLLFVGKIESYSQRAAIEFYESKQAEDCYITTFGFKSYAHLFYSRMRPPTNAKHADESFLLRGQVEKPTYIVGKITAKTALDTLPSVQFLYEKNGFVFYERL